MLEDVPLTEDLFDDTVELPPENDETKAVDALAEPTATDEKSPPIISAAKDKKEEPPNLDAVSRPIPAELLKPKRTLMEAMGNAEDRAYQEALKGDGSTISLQQYFSVLAKRYSDLKTAAEEARIPHNHLPWENEQFLSAVQNEVAIAAMRYLFTGSLPLGLDKVPEQPRSDATKGNETSLEELIASSNRAAFKLN